MPCILTKLLSTRGGCILVQANIHIGNEEICPYETKYNIFHLICVLYVFRVETVFDASYFFFKPISVSRQHCGRLSAVLKVSHRRFLLRFSYTDETQNKTSNWISVVVGEMSLITKNIATGNPGRECTW